ncbi:hypothetical protein SAMN04515695_5665 [Pseudovibrio sp. Tun.PSC04-5.I4]|nr:hypothetical protein SAMN04515695_5665 [Pseudovibrio sp. Tun.PSC04-5.I4]
MRVFYPVVQAFVGAAICIWSKGLYRFDIAAQFIRYHDPWLTKLFDKFFEKPFGSLGVPVLLNQDIEHVTICVNRPPEPVYHPTDGNNHLIQMPFIIWLWPIFADAIGKTALTVNAESNFPTCAGRKVLSLSIW